MNLDSLRLGIANWYPGQVWYLIVSIPDLCTLTYFNEILRCLNCNNGICDIVHYYKATVNVSLVQWTPV